MRTTKDIYHYCNDGQTIILQYRQVLGVCPYGCVGLDFTSKDIRVSRIFTWALTFKGRGLYKCPNCGNLSYRKDLVSPFDYYFSERGSLKEALDFMEEV